MPQDGIVFGEWSLRPSTRSLAGPDGNRVTLGSRAADILLSLIKARGEIVGKDELIRRAWDGLTVDDSNLAVQIAALRKAFGKAGGDIVVNVPGRGYRFGGAAPSQTATDASTNAGRPPTLAVLPFRVISHAPDDAWFADGVVEDLITALSRVRSFFVMARNSSFTLRGRELAPHEAGRELGMRYIVTGTMRRADERVRVNIKLDDALDNVSIWGDRVDCRLDDIFTLQDQLVSNVVAAIEPNLRRAELERLNRQPTEHASAYDLYLRATALMHPLTRENCAAALALLDQALAIDPQFARALAAAASCWGWRVSQSFRDHDGRERDEGIRLMDCAILSGADDPVVLAQAAMFFAMWAHRSDAAVEFARRAVSLHPNSVRTRASAGWVDLCNDEYVSAIVHFEEALRFDPLDPSAGLALSGISTGHLALGHLEAAVESGERAIAASPELRAAHRAYVAALGLSRLPAQSAVARLLELDPQFNLADYTEEMAIPMQRAPTGIPLRLEGLRRAGVPAHRDRDQ
jgi:TolB-like protein/Tfp pilus assembly protein PilF